MEEFKGGNQHQRTAGTNQEPAKDGMGEDNKNKEDTNTIPKEVRFNLPKGEGMEQDRKGKVGDGKTGKEEVEIEFVSKQPQQDDMSALSRSIGKQWEDDESMIVWETNDNDLGLDDKNSELEDIWNKEPNNNTNHKSVKELQEKLRDRESKDTDSMEWLYRDLLPRRSPWLEAKKTAMASSKPVKEDVLGVVKNKEGLRRSMQI